MKVKLIKTGLEDYHMGHYFLNDTNYYAIGSTDFRWCKTSAGKPKYKLSKENCDEIFGVVDINKWANEKVDNRFNETDGYHKFVYVDGIVDGFNKAIELNKDKLFTVEDMKKAILWAHDKSTEGVYLSRLPVDEFIQSLQQSTEIEVEIEVLLTERDGGVVIETPKLDKDGCLILKIK
jgi:hypothetical protein